MATQDTLRDITTQELEAEIARRTPPPPPRKIWHVLDDSGYDDCRLDSFAEKNEAKGFAKETLDRPSYRYESVMVINETDRSQDFSLYATAEQIQRKRDHEASEKAQIQEAVEAQRRDRESGFHWREGWFFKRMDDGSVRVSKLDENQLVKTRATIPAPEWASIVCSVSANGETGERWQEAQDFHGR